MVSALTSTIAIALFACGLGLSGLVLADAAANPRVAQVMRHLFGREG